MIVDMVRSSTTEVCSMMLNLNMACEEAYTETQPPGGTEGVVSFIGLAGKRAGTGSLHCSSDVACRLASSFLMAEFESVNEEVLDAFGELTNMVIGSLKNHLENHLGPMGLSIPTVIYGRNFNTRSLSHDEWTVVPFLWDGGQLNVKVCLKETEDGERSGRHGSRH
jgi:chemotaxis protein CheX